MLKIKLIKIQLNGTFINKKVDKLLNIRIDDEIKKLKSTKQ
jgi:hypothetical protein